MAIVIDINVIAITFDPASVDNAEFAPVLDWIMNREGFLLFGGTTYKKELSQSPRMMRLVRLLKDAGQAIEICSAVVDKLETDVRTLCAGTNCNDPHIIALLAAAKCGLLCSRDKKSFPHVKNKAYYPQGSLRVQIYTGLRNKDLLKRYNNRTDIKSSTV